MHMKRGIPLLIALATLLLATALHAQTFGAVLTASQETPPTSSAGFGEFTVSFDSSNNLIFEVDESGITGTPTAAHIHKGAAGVAASPLIAFTSSTNTFQNGHLRGVVTGIDAATAADIQAN